MSAPQSEPRAPGEKSAWWRTVLGEYPTGVTLLTSVDPEGQDIGMVVGTFTAVSEHPPLIGFMPTRTSYNAGLIKANGTFCANVLGYGHEALCRAFATHEPERFDLGEWQRSELGNARLTDAVAWFEGRITQVTEMGDHDFVLAEVTGLGLGDGSAGLPLLFLKGGYGSFTVPSLNLNLPGLASRLRIAENVRAVVQRLADETGTECLLSTLADDSVVVLTAANLLPHRARSGLVGMVFPFAAPMGSALAAWGPPERENLWRESARHLLGHVDRPLLAGLLDSVRQRGYAVSVGNTMAESFDDAAIDPNTTRADLSRLWEAVAVDTRQTLDPSMPLTGVSSLQFPVFDADGHTQFELVVSGMPTESGTEAFLRVVERAIDAAAELTRLGGGRVPEGFPLSPPQTPNVA